MPPKNKFTQEEITDAAVRVVRLRGAEALTARTVADALGASTKVIFGLFENIQALRQAVIDTAYRNYSGFLQRAVGENEYPPYKASGMAYIRFAQEETALFRLLFMRDRTGELPVPDEETERVIRIIMRETGFSRTQAEILHLEMWICVHGIATLQVTSFQKLSTELISRMLTDIYQGICFKIREG